MNDFFDAMKSAIGENDSPTAVSHWLNTGHPLLNDILSGSYHGGMPSGRIVEMMGGSSSGKTAIATQVMIAAQKAGGVAAFMDHERSFDQNLAAANGLDLTGKWIFKAPDTFEQSCLMAIKAAESIRSKKLISPDSPIVFVFDSLAAMVPKSKFGKDLDEYNMNDNTALARATSAVFPSLALHAEAHDFLALFLNQTRMKPGVVYGDPETSPGGNAPEFYSSVRIKLRRQKKTEGAGDSKTVVGQTITAECIKNKVHRPFEKTKWDIIFTDEGHARFDSITPILDHLIDTGVIEKKGHRVEWDGKLLYPKEVIDRINTTGDPLPLYSLLPGWDEDVRNAKQKIDWTVSK